MLPWGTVVKTQDRPKVHVFPYVYIVYFVLIMMPRNSLL